MSFSFERVRQSLRTLSRHKRFSALAILSLGISIALNTTMYSVLDSFISPKLLMREPERLYFAEFFGDYQRRVPIHDRNAAILGTTFQEGAAGISGTYGEQIIERGARLREGRVVSVTPNFFALQGVRASAGRLLSDKDLGLAENRPVVLSERMWKQLFPEKEAFEPSSILLNGEGRAVVGLLPYQADFPGANTDMWQLPASGELSQVPLTLVRLKPGVTREQAVAELRLLGLRFRQITGEDSQTGYRFLSATKPPFRMFGFHYALIGSVIAVLLIACANLANLQLARGVSRSRELATRAAVGASRADIVTQLLLESAWLALGGLMLGAVLTAWGIRVMEASVPPVLSNYVTHPQVSWRVLTFAVGAMLFCLMLVGLAPALKLSRVDVNELLKSGAGTGKSRSTRRQYGLLVVSEVGLALSLLSSAALLLKAAVAVHTFRISHDRHGLIFGFARVMRDNPADLRTRRNWSDLIINQALKIDSVVYAATRTNGRPPKHAIAVYDAAGLPVNHFVPLWGYSVVSPDYLRALKIPVTRGRDFSPGEFAEVQVIVDSNAARSLWPGKDAVGQQIKLDSSHTQSPWLTVVGVAGGRPYDWFNTDFDAAEQQRKSERARATSGRFGGQVYVLNGGDTAKIPLPVMFKGRRVGGENYQLVVRTLGDPRRLPIQLRRTIPEIGPGIQMGFAQTWEQWTGIDRLRAQHDFVATLFATFAGLALALAALGVYAIIAHMVAQRRREFGVRIAIGAGSTEIRQLVLREGNVLALSGIAVGLLITAYSASLIRAFVFSDYDRYDSRIFAVASLVLFGIAWLASYIPARRAMRIDPVEALRSE